MALRLIPHRSDDVTVNIHSLLARGISLMVERQFSKLRAGVRFSYPAQKLLLYGRESNVGTMFLVSRNRETVPNPSPNAGEGER